MRKLYPKRGGRREQIDLLYGINRTRKGVYQQLRDKARCYEARCYKVHIYSPAPHRSMRPTTPTESKEL